MCMDNNRQFTVSQCYPNGHQDTQISRKLETCNSKIGVFAKTATKVHEGIFYMLYHASGFVPL